MGAATIEMVNVRNTDGTTRTVGLVNGVPAPVAVHTVDLADPDCLTSWHASLHAPLDGETVSVGAAEVIGQALDEVEQMPRERTWTFFGHWGDDGHLALEWSLRGEHQDARMDTGYWEGGLFAASGTGIDEDAAHRAVLDQYDPDAEDA